MDWGVGLPGQIGGATVNNAGAHGTELKDHLVAIELLLQGGETIPQACQAIVDLEHQADDITREVMQAVRRSFITPFDRSDIQALIQSMDDAIDRMNGTVKTVRLFEVTRFEPNMQAIGKVAVEAAQLLAEAIPLLERPGANVARLTELTEKIVQAEGRSDDLHDEGLKQLFRTHGQSAPMPEADEAPIEGETRAPARKIARTEGKHESVEELAGEPMREAGEDEEPPDA